MIPTRGKWKGKVCMMCTCPMCVQVKQEILAAVFP